MSDTDEDLVPNSFHRIPYQKSVIHGTYGNMTTSRFNQPNQFLGFDQRSMYTMRETSPVSLQSFPSSRMHLQQSYTRGTMSSRGSVYNARCRSPMSVRSIDTNASVSASDIAMAFKTMKFNKYDLRIIQEAYNAHMKNRMRRRIGKKRNLKSFIKQCRRKSGGDSGDEGSNSSISSDDCRSTRSAFHTESISRVRSRPPKMDLRKFTTQIKENDIYKDCTENFKKNSFRNLLSGNNRTVNHTFMPYHDQLNVQKNHTFTNIPETCRDQSSKQIPPSVTLKDRLAKDNSTLLPFQRFNKSGLNQMHEMSYKEKSSIQQKESASNRRYEDTDNRSDDDIFPQSTSRLQLQSTLQKKRVLENDNTPEKKRKKLSTSPDNQNKLPVNKQKSVTNNNDFNFKKPQLPVRKIGPGMKSKEPEILISKSSQPLFGNLDPIPIQLKEKPQIVINKGDKQDSIQSSKSVTQNHIDSMNSNADTTQNSTDVSMKPSFIKRKLFTQKLDIAENKNVSSDNLNSPQTKVLRTCREKNKVRKLTSQSCLSNDILGDSSHLDLIHKIVPPDQIKNQNLNVTKATNKKETSKNCLDKKGKWDVTLAVSASKLDNNSDTYTDEEIFNLPQEKKKKSPTNKNTDKRPKTVSSLEKKSKVVSKCTVVVQKLPESFKDITELREECPKKRTNLSCAKSFWDTDYETDMDDAITLSSRTFKTNQITKPQITEKNNNTNVFKSSGTILSTTSPHKLNMNQSLRSCRLRANLTKNNTLHNFHADKENNSNTMNRSTRSRSKNKDTVVKNKTEANKPKPRNQKTKPKDKTPGKINKIQSESIFNISRESLRQKTQSVSPLPKDSNQNNKTLNKSGNTSRESMRLKQKREVKLNCKKNIVANKKRANVK
ncbi:ankyrin repeat domain-containing protein 12 [Bicyclus anynana]|uniref:Ankyrin repeat domain-containing protein 12 n=1 Tax=Bicyclus anynana TaxID=110368 RepID=A0A6J1MXF3_BICAN|nr:ankyrin repeat domain-containing protein 12 [Bicyclus anynana]